MLLPVRRRVGVALLAVLTAVAGLGLAVAAPAGALPNTTAYALTAAGTLVPLAITPATAGPPPTAPAVTAGTPVTVTGLTAGHVLVGIDFRPVSGALIGVGINPATGAGSVYHLALTGAATGVGAFTVAPGTTWGVDFNPTVDRIRLVGANGTSYRLHPDTGALAFTDSPLAFVAGDPNAGDTPAIASAGYTNNFGPGGMTAPNRAQATTLYALDAGNDVLVAIDNPNTSEVRTVGSLGVDIDTDAELDVTTNGLAYALVSSAGSEVLRTVNLASGALGAASAPIALGSPIVGFAVETGASPVVPGDDGYAVTDSGALLTFELGTPASAITVGPVTGLPAGFLVEGLDTRPANGALYAIAINPTIGHAQLATIDRASAAATMVGSAFPVAVSTDYGFDFNPTVDRIRFVSSSGLNLRLHPDTGAVAATDGALAYNPGDLVTAAPHLTSTAYTNSFGEAKGTIHLGVDAAQDTVAAFTDSNGGKLRTVRGLSLAGAPVDVVGDTGLDVAADGRVFLAAAVGGATRLFTLNPVTGALTSAATAPADTVGTGAALRAFAIGPDFVPRTTTLVVDAPIQVRGLKVRIELGLVSATLRSTDGLPVVGAPVVFRAGTTTLCTATTDAAGLARCPLRLAGLVKVLINGGYSASYAGSPIYLPTTGSTGLTG